MDNVCFSEYKDKMACNLKRVEEVPSCVRAVIPVITVEEVSGIKGLAGCFVHAIANNTTYYIDDKYRTIVVWAGAVEKPNYDYKKNPLGLRSQIVYDFPNNRAIYYNKQGVFRLINLSEK